MPAFRAILDCLDAMQINGDPHISTSWIFTFCYVKTVTWPKPALIKFVPDAFTNKHLREYAIILVLQFIDAIFCDSEPAPSTKWRWKWGRDSISRLTGRFAADGSGVDKRAAKRLAVERHASDKLVVMRLLVHHLLRIFFTFSESQQSGGLFNDLISREKSGGEGITNPALRLVIMAFGGHRKEVEVPPHSDPIWNDPVWQYALGVWFGFQTDYAVSNGCEIFDLVKPEQSAKLVDGLRRVNPLALNRLIKLSTRLRSSKVGSSYYCHPLLNLYFFISTWSFGIAFLHWLQTANMRLVGRSHLRWYVMCILRERSLTHSPVRATTG